MEKTINNVTTQDNNLIAIKVDAKQISYEGRKFWAYKCVLNHKYVDLKFTKAVDETKKPTGKGKIYVRPQDFNVARNTEYPLVWVSNIVAYESVTDKIDTLAENGDIEELRKMFD